MSCHRRPILLGIANPGMMGDSLSVLTEADCVDHHLDTPVNLGNKAEKWRGYLRCPCSLDPSEVGSWLDTLREFCGLGRLRQYNRRGAYTELGGGLNGWLKKAAALRK